jgi:hypothetical protein
MEEKIAALKAEVDDDKELEQECAKDPTAASASKVVSARCRSALSCALR